MWTKDRMLREIGIFKIKLCRHFKHVGTQIEIDVTTTLSRKLTESGQLVMHITTAGSSQAVICGRFLLPQ